MLPFNKNIRLFIFENRERIPRISTIIIRILAIFSIGTLIYFHGFHLNPIEKLLILNFNRVFFGAFVFHFLIRYFFSYDRFDFAKQNWLELIILLIILIGAINYYILKIPLIQNFFSNPDLDPWSTNYALVIQLFMVLLVVIEIARSSSLISSLNIKPSSLFIYSFILLIFSGAGLLMLPAVTLSGNSITFIDALFTSASASCVTGLTVLDTVKVFNIKGQLIILFLIQVGGLGILTFATFFASFLKKGVGVRQQSILQEIFDSDSLSGTYQLLRRIFVFTLSIEIIGAFLLYFLWGNYPFKNINEQIYFSLFHSISAFCNAGFALFSNGLYEQGIRNLYLFHIVIALLIIFGGLGFPAIRDIFDREQLRKRLKLGWKRWKLSTQIAVYASIALILVGTLLFYLLEKENTLAGLGPIEQIITAFFQSVTTRTAGFNTVDMTQLGKPILMIFIFLMFIGASSGGTGGGIKTSTFVVIFKSLLATVTGQRVITLGRRTISHDLVYKAQSVFLFSASFIFVCSFLLSITEPNVPILDLVFEEVSAFATVGLSTGVTPNLSIAGKLIITFTMLIGRVGILTLAFALSIEKEDKLYKYPNSHIMIG